jgi:carboxypeptidase Q
MKHILYGITASIALVALAPQSVAIPPPTAPNGPVVDAYDIVEGLTRDVGPRQAGTSAEQKGRDWAVRKLKTIGFSNVRDESFMMPTWVRGRETAEIIASYGVTKMPLSVTALGNSGSTGPEGVTGDLVYFQTFDDFVQADPDKISGKIVFIDHQMSRTQDGSSYGYFGRARFQGPNLAAKKGALAILVRSIGSAPHDHPHTGNTNFDNDVQPIPAAAISNIDADALRKTYHHVAELMRPFPMGTFAPPDHDPKPLALHLTLTPQNLGQQKSGNVIAEVPGSDPALPPILIACHLDSWDLGTGAIDDASGCGIITAAANNIRIHGTPPKRTIRLLWAGAEEVGVWGGKAYSEKFATEPHALAMESDFGADRVWAVDFNLPESAKALQDRIARRLALLGVVPRKDKAGGGADIGPIIAKQGLGVIDLQQDGTRYFDIHHNATDTIERIDKQQLRQNVVAWTTVLEEVANYEGDLKPEVAP